MLWPVLGLPVLVLSSAVIGLPRNTGSLGLPMLTDQIHYYWKTEKYKSSLCYYVLPVCKYDKNLTEISAVLSGTDHLKILGTM